MGREYKEIKAVHEDDLESLLITVGLSEDFHQGRLRCKFCRATVDKENIASVLKVDGVYKLACNKPSCVVGLMEYLETRRRSKHERA